jgi:siroheme synthase
LTGARANDGEFKRNLSSSTADTLVILMGVKHLSEIARDLIAAGRSGETPAAVIRWGSYEGQQTVCGTLDSIAEAAEQAEMRAPAVIVIGEVVKLRERLQWFESTVRSSLWEDLELAATA